MNIFHCRPFAVSVCAFAASALLAFSMALPTKLIMLILSVIGVIVGIVWGSCGKARWGRLPSLILLISCACAIALGQSVYWFDFACKRLERLGVEEFPVEGYVAERLNDTYVGSAFYVKTTEINGEPIQTKLLLQWK